MKPKKEVELESGIKKVVGSATDYLKFYDPPALIKMGNIRNLTLGGSPGIGDSAVGGDPAIEQAQNLDLPF